MKKLIITFLFFVVITATISAKITLPKLVGDNMVLQQSATVNVWGKSTSKKVTITTSWNNKKYYADVNNEGSWISKIKTPLAGGPYSITIDDGEKIVLNNILIGEVWICSGQSNMEMPIKGFGCQPVIGGLEASLEAAKYDKIRMFTVARNSQDKPQQDCKAGEWLCSSFQSVADFSATAYFFGKTIV